MNRYHARVITREQLLARVDRDPEVMLARNALDIARTLLEAAGPGDRPWLAARAEAALAEHERARLDAAKRILS